MSEQQNRYYEFGEFRIDALKRVLLRDGQPIHLTSKVFELLRVLVESRGRVLEKDELMQLVWPDTIVEEANLKNSISTLRKALGDERGASHYIQTLPKRGYKFIAPVIAIPDEDETYLIEKRTTTELVIDTISEDSAIAAIDGNQSVIASDLREPLSADEDGAGASRSEATTYAIAGERRAPQLLPGKGNFIGQIMRRPFAAAVGTAVLLVVTAAIALGLYRWMRADKARPSFAFESMKMIRLTNVGNYTSVISPDGKYIAYIMDGTPTDGLWVRQTTSDSAIKLLPNVNCWGMTFSKDSNYVYCTLADREHPEGVLYKIPVLGGPPKLVLERLGGGVSFSPDGKRLAFKRINKEVGNSDLITAGADGSDERIILSANARALIWTLSWSPDGKRIAYSVNYDAVDGKANWQLKEIPADGGEERPITSPQKEAITDLIWLPDGSGLVIVAADKDTRIPQLWQLSYPDGQAARITNDSSFYASATITADGETMLAQRRTAFSNLWVADTGNLNRPRKITADGSGYDDLIWTPDGRILHSQGDNGKSDVSIMNADGTGRERLTDDQSQNLWPAISPDGRFIIYSSKRSGQRQIWRMDSNGHTQQQLTNSANACIQPKITPDGQWVVYLTRMSGSGWALGKIPIDGGESVRLVDRTEGFVISPDGKKVAYVAYDEQKKRKVILVKPIDGGEPVKVFDYPDLPIYQIEEWTKDGLLCIKIYSTQIILIPVDGQPPKQLTDFKTGERIFSFALSADGKQLALSLGISTSETLKITDFKAP